MIEWLYDVNSDVLLHLFGALITGLQVALIIIVRRSVLRDVTRRLILRTIVTHYNSWISVM